MTRVVNFQEVLEERYFAYALSTIKSRSLPDVRDGLKPVHRRLIHAMHELNLDPSKGYKKCARIVGDVIGKFHPHGDASVYDALVRMAQSFAMRYPIIEGQGNFGSIDGDSQAAMRYTEAKLTAYAMLLLRDIENDTVDFRPTYDGSEEEPVVLPAAIPNILANGAEGIAVGMATSIPPHNIFELIDACNMLIKNPQLDDAELLGVFKGPDFPTGGLLVLDEKALLQAYQTGRGSFRLRASWYREEQSHGKYQIVIAEIPYQVTKRRIIEQLADLYNEKKIAFIESFQDQSAEDIKIVIIPKSKNIEAEAIMQQLYVMTELEVKISLNLNVLNSVTQPVVMSLKQVLMEFLEYRRVTVKRKMRYQLDVMYRRLEILSGLKIAYLNLDEIIRIIREEDEPKLLMIQRFRLTDLQVEAILNTRLRSLRKLDEQEMLKEEMSLREQSYTLEQTISSDDNLMKYIKRDLEDIRKFLAKTPHYHRKTKIIDAKNLNVVQIFMPSESYPLTISLSKQGWLRAIKEHAVDKLRYRDGDETRFVLLTHSDQQVGIFSSYGKCYTVDASSIACGRGDGEPVKLMLNLSDDEEIVACFVLKLNARYLVVSRAGNGFIILGNDMVAHTKAGKQILNAEVGGAFTCLEASGEYVMTFGENRRLLVFRMAEIPQMKKGRGVVLQKLKNCSLSVLKTFDSAEEIESILPQSAQKLQLWLAKRGGLGRLVLNRIFNV